MNQRKDLGWTLKQQGQFKWPQQRPQLSLQTGESPPFQSSLYTPQAVTEQFPFPSRTGQWLPLQTQMPDDTQQVLKKMRKRRKPLTKGQRIRRWSFSSIIVLALVAVILFSQANGTVGAQTADIMRAVLGPSTTAQIESWFLGVSDTAHQVQYHLGNQHVNPPWTAQAEPIVRFHSISPTLAPMALKQIAPIITPAIAGEGKWITQGYTSPPTSFPLVAKAFVRPDATRPYAIVTLLQFDARFIALHMVAGTIEPGGARHLYGSGVIPSADRQGNALLAAFNGGFKYADGQYGMKANEIVYVPPQPGAATIAVTREGQILLGAWGVDPRLNSGNADLLAWRQNAAMLINHGSINSLANDGAAWGGTILNSAYTWRSGIGLTAQGTLLYAAGSSLSALTLGEALHAAGAVMAMQTDINPFWVRAFLYDRASNGTLQITKLNPGMQGTGAEYLYGTERDFFYLTRVQPKRKP